MLRRYVQLGGNGGYIPLWRENAQHRVDMLHVLDQIGRLPLQVVNAACQFSAAAFEPRYHVVSHALLWQKALNSGR